MTEVETPLEMTEVEIPVELITEILIRLPVKPLFRFKCVSKSWNSLISSRPFVSRHFKSNPNLNILFTPRQPTQSFFSALIHDDINTNNTTFNFSEFNHPFKFNDTYATVIDSTNGIFLISDSSKKTLFLYNPANNTYRLIPSIPRRNGEFFGFGYDSHTDDYKVVSIVQNRGGNLVMYVFSMRENSWKFIKDESSSVQEHVLHQGVGVCASGVIHFRIKNTFLGKPVLVCFDVRTESVSILDYPELEFYDFRVLTDLSELDGCLNLHVNYNSISGEIKYSDVWEYREASWVKLFRIQTSEVVGKDEPPCDSLRHVSYSKDKGKVLIEVYGGLFVWYDLATKRVEEVETHGLRDEYSYGVMTYVESLFSLGNGKAAPVSVSKGGSTPKKAVDSTNMRGFLSKGFKLKL